MSRPAEADQLVLTQCVTHGRGVLAGMGRSASATDGLDAAWSMADFADDAAGLLRALGVATCYVVGWSFGGMVAQHLAQSTGCFSNRTDNSSSNIYNVARS